MRYYQNSRRHISNQSFNLSPSVSSSTEGATALKIDNDFLENQIQDQIITEVDNIASDSKKNLYSNTEEANININDSEIKSDNLELDEKKTNGLENFNLEEETLELFNSDEITDNEKAPNSFDTDDKHSEKDDEFEIPAFLRRQKN